MKYFALSLSLLGILSLLIILIFVQNASPPIKNISNLNENQKLTLSGTVISEKNSGKIKILTLDNSLQLQCSCPLTSSYLNKKISALVYVEKYKNKTNLNILEMRILK